MEKRQKYRKDKNVKRLKIIKNWNYRKLRNNYENRRKNTKKLRIKDKNQEN